MVVHGNGALNPKELICTTMEVDLSYTRILPGEQSQNSFHASMPENSGASPLLFIHVVNKFCSQKGAYKTRGLGCQGRKMKFHKVSP